MRIKIFLIILSCALGANAATFNVTKTADTADGVCDADCSLREAISAANSLAGADIINLPAGIYTTTIPTTNENSNANGDFDILGEVKIIGANMATTIVQANAAPGVATDRVFQNNAMATFENLTVRNGRLIAVTGSSTLVHGGGILYIGSLILKNVTISDNECRRRGGGVYGFGPNLSLDRVTVTGNKALAIASPSSAFGGGVHSNNSIVRIRKSTFTNNEARGTGATDIRGQGGGFYALDGTDITIKDSTFTGNIVEGADVNNQSDGGGLRFLNNIGPMTVNLDNVTSSNNQIVNGVAFGGGISIANTTVNDIPNESMTYPLVINLNNSTISNNTVNSSVGEVGGAGISSGSSELNATVNITNTNITGNTATSTNVGFQSSGGGIHNTNTNMNLQTSRISGNSAEIGGGIRNNADTTFLVALSSNLTISGSTISGNTGTNGGGIANIPGDTGIATNLSLKNATISGNFATNNGGGIYQDQIASATAATVINNSTIVSNKADSDNSFVGNGGGVNNFAGTATIKNTIVANNSVNTQMLSEKSDELGTIAGIDLAGNIVSADYNLFRSISGAVVSGSLSNSFTGIDPNLATLAGNGGFAQTHKPNTGSTVINNGDPANCQDNLSNAVTFDERGLPRDQGGVRCDIGAYEVGGIVWDGGGADNNFTTAANWEGDVAPIPTDYAIFNSTSSKDIRIDVSHEVFGVIYGGGYSGNMTIDGGSLRVRDLFYLYGGNIAGINNGFVDMAVGSKFVRYSGHVIGTINHDYVAMNENFLYPSGTSLGYYPVTLNYAPFQQKNPLSKNLGVSSFSVKSNDGALPGVDASQSIMTNWTFNSFGVSPADLVLSYNDEEVPAAAIEENFKFIRRESMANMMFAPSTVDTFDNTFRLNGVSSFSDWSLGNLAPTAASATISGRVLTSNGIGIKNVSVILTGGNLTAPVYSRTTSFGNYRLPEVQVGQTYVLTVNSKRYTFTNSSQVVNLQDNLEEFNFVSETP